MPGCTRLITGIPDPLPDSPIFLYMGSDGRPLPPPNYVPNVDDCADSGCGCGCSSGSSGSGGGCGCGAANPGLPAGCDSDPGKKQLDMVNDLLRKASQVFSLSKV